MKKIFFIFILFVFVFLSISSISASKIAYLVKYPNNLNQNEIAIEEFLSENGHSVFILDDVAFNADNYDFIIVGDGINDIEDIFDHTTHRTLFLSSTAAKNTTIWASS